MSSPADLAALADELLALTAARPPTLGVGRLVCLDGPAGSGKTTLAEQVAARAGHEVPVVHMDDLYDGWGGLPTVADRLGGLLGPLAEGRPGSYRRYDWHAGAYAERVVVPPSPLLVLEGVGSGAAAYAHLVTVLVWLDAPEAARRQRALARDGEVFAPHWEAWARAEAAHLAREGTRGRADLVVDTGA